MGKTLPKLAIILPHLQAGGAETAAVNMSCELNNDRLRVLFVLGQKTGPLLERVPADLPVATLRHPQAMRSVADLARLLRRQDVAAVYSATNARNIATLLALGMIPAARRPVAIISEHTSPRDYLAAARAPWLRRRLMRALYPRADLLVAPADGLAAAWLDALGLDRPAVATLANPILGAAELRLAARVAAGTGPRRDGDLVLSVGRLHPAKGHDVLLRGFAAARQRRPGLRLVILGEGDARAALQAQAAELGLGRSLSMPGHSDDVAGWMAQAGLLVVPSRREGFGNVVVEALAQGTPVLATDCDGPRGILAGAGLAGRLVPVGDAGALARGIAEMAGSEIALAAALGAARDLVRRHSVAAAAAAFADRVEALVATRGTAAPRPAPLPV